MLSGLRGEIGALRHELVILQLGNASPQFTPKQVWHRFFVPFWGGRRHDSVGKKQVAMAWPRIIENSRRSCDDYGFCFKGKWNGTVLLIFLFATDISFSSSCHSVVPFLLTAAAAPAATTAAVKPTDNCAEHL